MKIECVEISLKTNLKRALNPIKKFKLFILIKFILILKKRNSFIIIGINYFNSLNKN